MFEIDTFVIRGHEKVIRHVKRRMQLLRGERDVERNRHNPVLRLINPARRDRKS